jgi:phenylacetate-CoA ligase
MEFSFWNGVVDRYFARELSNGELRKWQEEALVNVLKKVKNESAFYRRHLRQVEPAAVTLSNLKDLPFTTKEDLAHAMYDLICGSVKDGIYLASTTGTTGKPVPCPRNLLDFETDNRSITIALREVVKHWLEPGEKPVLAMLGPNEMHSVCLSISSAVKEVGILKLDVFPLSPVIGFKRLFELLQELEVNMLIGSPGLIMALAEMSLIYGVDVRNDLNIKCILCCGELCSPSMTKLVESTWGAKSCNWWYGQQEIGTSHVSNAQGEFVSVLPNYVLEVIDLETKLPMEKSGRGELCLTSLVPGMKPLVRYRTGDYVEYTHGELHELRIRFLGRLKDRVEINGRSRAAADIEEAILTNNTCIYGYQLEMSHRNGVDFATIYVKAKDDVDIDYIKDTVAGNFDRSFQCPAEVKVTPLLDLASATGGWVTWKTARIRDKRSDMTVKVEKDSADALAKIAAESV